MIVVTMPAPSGRGTHAANVLREPALPAPCPEPRIDPEAEKFKALEAAAREGVKVVAVDQLFPTPPDVAARMVREAEILPGHRVLEPSFGTGNLLRAIGADAIRVGVEIVDSLVNAVRIDLTASFGAFLVAADFLATDPGTIVGPGTPLDPEPARMGKFDRIIMNPPFKDGADIRHIAHALRFLADGGRLVAICADGPRQREKLYPLASMWKPMPDAFKDQGTNVRTVMLVIERESTP